MINAFNRIKGIPVGVWSVSISMMLVAIATAMTYSISPFFITKVLGLSMVSLGVMEGVSEALSYLFKLGSGYSSDVFKRKKTPLLTGVIMTAISKPIFIFANGAGMIMTSKIIERMSNGIMSTPRDAYCADAVDKDMRGACIGLMMSLKTFGCTVGSLTIGALMIYTENYTLLLWFSFIPCLLAVIVLLKYMKETKRKADSNKSNNIKLQDIFHLSKNYWGIVIVASIFMCARYSEGFILLRMSEIGAPIWLCGMTIGIFNLISAFACLPIGSLSDKLPRSKVLYISFIALILSNLCFVYASGLLIVLIGVMLWGVQRGTSQVLFTAIIADCVPQKIMGTAIGIFYVFSGVISVLSGFLAGKFAEQALQNTFYFGLCASTAALIALFLHNSFKSKNK